MLDLFYCMTQALNDAVLLTVQFDKNKFAAVASTKQEGSQSRG